MTVCDSEPRLQSIIAVQKLPWPTAAGIRSEASNTNVFAASASVIVVAKVCAASVS